MKNNIFGLKIIVSVILISATVSIVTLFLYDTAEANNINSSNSIPKAVIIDQLFDDDPNLWFHQHVSRFFEQAGYEVDIFTTKDITVDFYKSLPSRNYKFVVVRSHGVADENDQNSVSLFSGEKYETEKYISEQLFGQIKKGAPLQLVNFLANGTDSQWVIVNDTYRTLSVPAKKVMYSDQEYFLITPTFIDSNMEGKFSDTTFLLGGCSTMRTDTMAQALIRKGASSVVGWDNTVSSFDNDSAMLLILERILSNKMELEDAVDSVMKDYPLERMVYPTRMIVNSDNV